MMAVSVLEMSPIDPIENIQCTVGPHKEDVIAGKIFYLTVALQDNQLWQYANRFQVNRKGPQQLDD
jgi:hypothetical protein